LWNRYHFPGNVRELRNIVIRLTAKYAGQTVDAAQLENELDLAPGPPDNAPPADLLAQARQTMATVSANGQSFDLDALLNSIERSLIEAALEISQGNVSQAAKLLGVGRTTLYSRMDKPDA
jgi:DNA-binding NtrC family response regulator